MGGDGGSIPTRCELVKLKKAAEVKNKDQHMVGKWQHCALSGQTLAKPIMSCRLGRLYNKEAVIETLLDKSIKSHIKKLSDVVELKLTDNAVYNSEIKADLYIDHYSAPFVCPVIGLEMSGRYRFIYNWSCGCAISERATIEIPSETCHKCGTPILKEDLIIINGTEEDIVKLTEQMKRRKEESKKGKKSKNHVVSEATSKDKLSVNNDEPAADDKPSKNKRHNIQDGNDKQHKKTKVSSDPKESKNKFEDTNSYKKLFHKNCEKKEKAHWVTYNPYYN